MDTYIMGVIVTIICAIVALILGYIYIIFLTNQNKTKIQNENIKEEIDEYEGYVIEYCLEDPSCCYALYEGKYLHWDFMERIYDLRDDKYSASSFYSKEKAMEAIKHHKTIKEVTFKTIPASEYLKQKGE